MIKTWANSAGPDEVAHNEPPHLDHHCMQIRYFQFSTFSGTCISIFQCGKKKFQMAFFPIWKCFLFI